MRKMAMLFLVLSLSFLSGCKIWDNWFGKKTGHEAETEIEKTLSKNIINISSEDSFESEVLKSDKPVIVKFETEWCGICKLIIPLYNQLADRFKGKINFVKIDADDFKAIAEKYEIAGVPTFIFFKDGKVAEKVVGAMEEDEFLEKIKELFDLE